MGAACHFQPPTVPGQAPSIRPSQLGGIERDTTAWDDELARHLEATGRYRVLRRLPEVVTAPCPTGSEGRPAGVALGIALDTETTGVDHRTCEVIELAMVAFRYSRADGRILGVARTFAALQQPSAPIPPEIVRLTRITDADVAGRNIDAAEVAAFVEGADLVLAHNAAFDRPFCEARWPVFARKPWACTYREIDWAGEGYEGAKLGHLLMQSGHFHTGHRALDDVGALMHLLSLPLPVSRRTGLAALLGQARSPTVRVWAEGAPYAFKDHLKARGYRWSDGSAGSSRAWYRDVAPDEADGEIEFLRASILHDPQANPPRCRVTAWDRYSTRTDGPVG